MPAHGHYDSIFFGRPVTDLANVVALAEEFSKAIRLTRYHEGLRDETIRRQKTDLLTFTRFLHSVGVQAGDLCHDLAAWQGIRAGLLEAFIEWQKLEGYAIGSINIRLATVKAYCHLAYEVGILDIDTHTHIQGVKGIPRRQARNIDACRGVSRVPRDVQRDDESGEDGLSGGLKTFRSR
jgi:site-specific recombinase XerC